MKKILFIAPHRKGRAPGQRFRFEQYINYLQENDFECTISNIIDEKEDKYFYRKGYYWVKLYVYLKSIFVRIKDIIRSRKYDVIFIYREALFTRSSIIERILCKINKVVFVDFDDAIFLLDVSAGNQQLSWLKNHQKINKTLQKCTMSIVGNDYLADYARQFCNNVTVFPTTLDLNTIKITEHAIGDKICIGWIGSRTTIKHIEWAAPILRKIQNKYGNKVYFKVVADVSLNIENVDIENVMWSQEIESEQLSSFDIGIMPLPDNEWTRGKCGFKGLQCMAYKIPVVMSPVGVNTKIIQDGINGYLADTENEWLEKISLLIDNATLRRQIGEKGRKTVEESYSFQALKDIYLSYFKKYTDA